MNFFHAVILGVVEGITEYLPISSTGHLILTSSLLNIQNEAVKTFEVVIQSGAILAVIGLYRTTVLKMIRGIIGRDKDGLKLLINLFIAFLPAAFFGLLLHKKIKASLFYPIPVACALAIGGIAMIVADLFYKKDSVRKVAIENLTIKQSVFIGLAQCFALFPGFSRSMATILGGLIVGMDRKQSAEFSFLLALPTLGMACLFDFYKGGENLITYVRVFDLLTGFIVSGIVAALSIKWLISWLTKHGFAPFGWYRLLIAGIVLFVWEPMS